jgi:hypothetical protein
MVAKDKRGHSVGYFSAYYRGLECLLDMWPAIRKAVPDATLDIAYGWQSWLGIEGKNEFYHRMEAKFAAMAEQGVTVHDRLSHVELAKLMKRTRVWAYPTEFAEINCITALKAQEAGMIPVVTPVAALKEVVQSGVSLHVGLTDIYTNKESQDIFIEAVRVALTRPIETHPVPGVGWDEIATKWQEVMI